MSEVQRTVKYHKHATLTKRTNLASRELVWEFLSDDFERAYHDVRLVEILDDLSEDGYMLICSTGDELILRTKEEVVEEVADFYEMGLPEEGQRNMEVTEESSIQ